MTTGLIGFTFGLVVGWYLNGRDGGVQFPKPHMPPPRWSLWLATVRRAASLVLVCVGLIVLAGWALGGCNG